MLSHSSLNSGTPAVGAYATDSAGDKPGSCSFTEESIRGFPSFLAVPIVAFALFPRDFASALWAIIPLGKYNLFPIPERSSAAGVSERSWFNSIANGFMPVRLYNP